MNEHGRTYSIGNYFGRFVLLTAGLMLFTSCIGPDYSITSVERSTPLIPGNAIQIPWSVPVPISHVPGISGLPECDASQAAEITLQPAQSHTEQICLKPEDWAGIEDSEKNDIELYFLVDSTGSMSGSITNLKNALASIVTEVATFTATAKYGLADFRDYPAISDPVGSGGQDSDWPYRLMQPLTEDISTIQSQLASLVAGGGGDLEETAVEALYQLATGEGAANPPIAPSAPEWSPRKTRIVMLITDSPFKDFSTTRDLSRADMYTALKNANIHVIPISIGNYGPTLSHLTEAARETNSFAGQDLDFNHDGIINASMGEIQKGDPLVFRLNWNGEPLDEGASAKDMAGIVVTAIAEIVRFNLTAAVSGAPSGLTVTLPRPLTDVDKGATSCLDVTLKNNLGLKSQFTCQNGLQTTLNFSILLNGSIPLTSIQKRALFIH